MRQLRIFIILLAFTNSIPGLYAQNSLQILNKNGADYSFELNDIRSFRFSEGNMVVTTTENLTENYAVDLIRKFLFVTGIPANISSTKEEESDMQLYPNPSTDFIYVKNLKDIQTATMVQIINMQGKILDVYYLEVNKDGRIEIPVSKLPTGIYLCRVKSVNEIISKKFIKN